MFHMCIASSLLLPKNYYNNCHGLSVLLPVCQFVSNVISVYSRLNVPQQNSGFFFNCISD